MITVSIDVTKIDKARIKEVKRRNGETAKFLDLVLFECDSEYGDYIVKQGVTKEERAAKKEMPIIGNGKKFHRGKQASHDAPEPTEGDAPPSDDAPF